MGNCIDRNAVVSWTDDDDSDGEEWEWTAAGAGNPGRPVKKKQQELKEHLLSKSPRRAEDPHHRGPVPAAAPAAADPTTHEVKIKISKRRLEDLVGKSAGGGGDGVEGLRNVLESLIGSGGCDWQQVAREAAKAGADAAGQHQWRPNLQSIPEGAE